MENTPIVKQCIPYDIYRELIDPTAPAFDELPEERQAVWVQYVGSVLELLNRPVGPGADLLPRCPTCRLILRPNDFIGSDIKLGPHKMVIVLCKHCRHVLSLTAAAEENRILDPTRSYV